MPIVRNDTEALSDLISRLRQFRDAALEGENSLRQNLWLEVGSSWRDSRYAVYQQRFDTDFALWHVRVDKEIRQLEAAAQHLRERLDDYLFGEKRSARTSDAPISVQPPQVQNAALTELDELLFPKTLKPDAKPLPAGVADAAKKLLLDIVGQTAEHFARGLAMTLLAKLGIVPPLGVWGLLQDPFSTFVLLVLGTPGAGAGRGLELLRSAAGHTSIDVRFHAVQAAACQRRPEANHIVRRLAHDPEPRVRHAARDAMIRRRVSDDAQAFAMRAATPGAQRGPSHPSTRAALRDGRRPLRMLLRHARQGDLASIGTTSTALSSGLDADATEELFIAARSAFRSNLEIHSQLRPAASVPPRTIPPEAPLASQNLLRSLHAAGVTTSMLAAPHGIVHASANCVAAVRALAAPAPSACAVAFAAAAVASAQATPDRGLLAISLLARAAAERVASRFSEALASCDSAQQTWDALSAAERFDWSTEPIEEAIVLCRAAVLADTTVANDVDSVPDLISDAALLLARRCVRYGGNALDGTFAGTIIDHLLDTFDCPSLTVADLQQRMSDNIAIIHHLAVGNELRTFVITARRLVQLQQQLDGDRYEVLGAAEERGLLREIDVLGFVAHEWPATLRNPTNGSVASDRYELFAIDAITTCDDSELAEDFANTARYELVAPVIDTLYPVTAAHEERIRRRWEEERTSGASAVQAFAAAQRDLRAGGASPEEWSAFRLRGDWRR